MTNSEYLEFQTVCYVIDFPIDYLFISTHGNVPWSSDFGCLNVEVDSSTTFEQFMENICSNKKLNPKFIYFNTSGWFRISTKVSISFIFGI